MISAGPRSLRESAESAGDIYCLQVLGHLFRNQGLCGSKRELIRALLVVIVEDLPQLPALCAGWIVDLDADVP